MIVAQFNKAVRVGRNYNIKIEFNVTFDQFLSYCVDAEQTKERPGHVWNLRKKVQENCKIMHFLNYSGGKILQCLTINDPADETIQTEKEILLVFATLGPNENVEVSPEPIPFRIVYRNDKHFSLSKNPRKDDITDTGWLPPCRPIKAVPFRDVWLIGR